MVFPPQPATLQMSPATVADIGAVHVDAYANASGLSRRSDSALAKRSIATKIAKFKCGLHGTGLANYDEGRQKFGDLADRAYSTFGSVAVSAVKMKIQNTLCDDGHELCDMLVSAAVAVPGLLTTVDLGDFYDAVFDKLREECKEAGGMAWLVADNPAGSDVCGIPTCTADGKMGLQVSTFEAQYYIHDGGDTCPAKPPTEEICEVSTFN